MIVLETKGLSVDLIEDGQSHVEILEATFHVLDSWVDLFLSTFDLLEIFLNVSLFHSLLLDEFV